jgi:KTSC domain
MEMIPVSSTSVAAVGYADDSQTLQIEFLNGTRYQYFDVPEHVFDALIAADSPGGYLAANIKGVYRYSKV